MIIIFSDEKKFNLDDPNEIQCYCRGLSKEEQVFSKRPFGGRSVMIRGAFSANGKAELVVMQGRQNAKKYVEMLETSPLLLAEVHHDRTSSFSKITHPSIQQRLLKFCLKTKMLPY